MYIEHNSFVMNRTFYYTNREPLWSLYSCTHNFNKSMKLSKNLYDGVLLEIN